MEFIHNKSIMEEIVLKIDDKPVSYLVFTTINNIILLDTLYTPYEHRGKHYATELLNYFLSKVTEPVYLVVKIGTFVGGFYQRAGFKKITKFGCYELLAYSNKSNDELLELWLNK